MNVFDANLNYLPCYDVWNDLVLDFVFRRYINDQKSIFFLEKVPLTLQDFYAKRETVILNEDGNN